MAETVLTDDERTAIVSRLANHAQGVHKIMRRLALLWAQLAAHDAIAVNCPDDIAAGLLSTAQSIANLWYGFLRKQARDRGLDTSKLYVFRLADTNKHLAALATSIEAGPELDDWTHKKIEDDPDTYERALNLALGRLRQFEEQVVGHRLPRGSLAADTLDAATALAQLELAYWGMGNAIKHNGITRLRLTTSPLVRGMRERTGWPRVPLTPRNIFQHPSAVARACVAVVAADAYAPELKALHLSNRHTPRVIAAIEKALSAPLKAALKEIAGPSFRGARSGDLGHELVLST